MSNDEPSKSTCNASKSKDDHQLPFNIFSMSDDKSSKTYDESNEDTTIPTYLFEEPEQPTMTKNQSQSEEEARIKATSQIWAGGGCGAGRSPSLDSHHPSKQRMETPIGARE